MADEPKITDGQRFAIFKLFERMKCDRGGRLWILSKLLEREVKTTADLTLNEWRTIRNSAYPNWVNNDWEISSEFWMSIREIKKQYEIEVLGQTMMF